MKKKGGVFDTFGALAVGVGTLAIILVVTFLILSQGRSQIDTIEGLIPGNATSCATSSACNATVELTEAVDDIPGWVPLIVIAVIGAALLGIVRLFKQ